jgi:hypothetical protein
MKKYILNIFLIISGLQLVQAQDDPFIGYFENKTEEFSLKIDKAANNDYICVLQLQGNTISFKGTKILGLISGILTFQGQSVSYSLSKLLGIYYFSLDGTSLMVEKGNPPTSKDAPLVKKDANQPDALWEKRISGKKLIYLYNSSGFSDKTIINLYSNKTFEGSLESVSVSQLGSGSTRNSANGTWKINKLSNGTWLDLTHKDGTSESFLLEQRQTGSEINMNGKRFFVTEIN